MADGDWTHWFRNWSDPESFAHPDSPAGGSGSGFSRSPGPQQGHQLWLSVPHPRSPAARQFSWHHELSHFNFEQRARAVYSAAAAAPRYVPQALYEATGQELHAIVGGIIPGLLLFLGILAASTALGAAAGAAVGALAFGIGAAPGAVAGAGLGFEAGIALLDFLGLAFLVGYIGGSLLEAGAVASEAVRMAWYSVDNRGTQSKVVDDAAHRLAFAAGLVFRGLLQGIAAFLLAKGTAAAASRVPELVSKLRASRLGAGFAEWVERNWKGLIDNPRLRAEPGSGGGSGAGSPPEKGPPPKEPPLVSGKTPNRSTWRTEPTGPKGAKPGGTRTSNKPNADSLTKRSLELENKAADTLANAGYRVEQNPKVPGDKKPDYLVEGEIFDCYSPNSSDARHIINQVNRKVGEGQADRIVLNLEDSGVTRHELREALSQYGSPDLKEIILIDQNSNIVRFFP